MTKQNKTKQKKGKILLFKLFQMTETYFIRRFQGKDLPSFENMFLRLFASWRWKMVNILIQTMTSAKFKLINLTPRVTES